MKISDITEISAGTTCSSGIATSTGFGNGRPGTIQRRKKTEEGSGQLRGMDKIPSRKKSALGTSPDSSDDKKSEKFWKSHLVGTNESVLGEAKRKPLKPEPKDPVKRAELRKKQGRCVSCGNPISSAGRGAGDNCKECSNDNRMKEY